MFGSTACTYSTGKATRCVDALVAERDRSHFLIGTASLLDAANQIQVVEYNSSANEVRLVHRFSHKDQVLHLAPSPVHKDLVFTCGKAKGEVAEAVLWKMERLDDGSDEQTMKPLNAVASLPTQAAAPSKVVWKSADASTTDATLASAHGKSVFVWKCNDGAISQADRMDAITSDELDVVTAIQWDPHHDHYMSVSTGSSIQTWDSRADETAFIIEDAHSQTVLDFDYNPNKPYTIVSGGDDGKLKFWDLRRSNKPLLSLANAHSHWLQSVRYNRFHDQLILTGGSDAIVGLWRVSSISSAPIVELDEQDLMNEAASGNDVVDTRIKNYEEHEDSVYSVAWGASDSWIFASVSYDGRFVVNQVPSTEKYKILL